MRITLLLILLVAACGDVAPSTKPDGGTHTPDGPGSGSGASCSAGDACVLDGAPGLCGANGKCGECVDTTDDAKCAAAYGAGNLCVQGQCEAATCHSSADCGGAACVDNQCSGCRSDSDCDSGQVCSSGACVAGGNVCSGKAIGSSCGAGDLCCNVGGTETCVTGQCCAAADCTAITGAGSTCELGTCVPSSSTCRAPLTATYYVDPAYTGPSTGSTACPFKTLHGAFNAVRNDGISGDSDVIIKGGTINATQEGGAQYFPLTVPSSVYVRTQSTALAPAVIIPPANTTAFEAPYVAQSAATSNWAARISNLEIKQATAGTGGTAVHVTGGTLAKPVHIDHVEVHNFFNGIRVDGGGKAALDWGVNAHDNASTGLYVSGGRVDMTVGTDADARSHFDTNGHGIYVTDDPNSVLTIAAGEPTTGPFAGLKMVTASGNANAGIHLASPNTNNSLLNVGLLNNAGNGLTLYGGANVRVRKLRIEQSGSSAIDIRDNGTLTSLANIDLGSAADLGHNELTGSVDSHVCVETTNDGSFLSAMGNVFGTSDCTVQGTSATVRKFSDCAGHGGGLNDPSTALIRESVNYCTFR